MSMDFLYMTILSYVFFLMIILVWIFPLYALAYWGYKKLTFECNSLIIKWANENSYTIVHSSVHRSILNSLTSSWSQRTFDVTIKDLDGRVRRGLVKCGGYLLGPWTGRVVVEWKEEKRTA